MGPDSGQFDWSIPDGKGVEPEQPSDPPATDSVIDRYQLLGEVGRGGMGVVYRARDVDLDREVALKVILDPGYDADSSRRERFRREGEITSQLRHPGIVQVLRAGEFQGQPYLVYELVDRARTLEEAFQGAGLAQRVEWLRDAARALGYAHRLGVLHRDVKPQNILLDRTQRVRVTDFGLAAGQGLDRLTRSGAMVGTPTFSAPELLLGKREASGPWSDVWSLGVILYQALTDRLPFETASLIELARLVTESDPPAIEELAPAAPRDLIAVCRCALSRDPQERYADADAFADDLEAWLCAAPTSAAHPVARTSRARFGLGAALLAALAVGLLAVASVWQVEPEEPAATSASVAPIVVLDPTPGSVHTLSLTLSGQVRASDWPVTLKVAGRSIRLEREAPFSIQVPLAWGENAIRVEVVDREGRLGKAEATVLRGAPVWVATRWPNPRLGPPQPLPIGLSYGAESGEFVNDKDGSVLVWVAPGRFRMGLRGGLPGVEEPVHDVSLTRGFFLGKYEVTHAQFEQFVSETSRARPVRPEWAPTSDHPVVFVSWRDARDYCAWAGLRLPTEAQWEFAARGARSRRFPWGDRPDRARMNALGSGDGHAYTSPVGSFPNGAAPCGALDMAGNVFEWVLDGGAKYRPEAQVDPFVDPVPAPARVIRGGAFSVEPAQCRTTFRDFAAERTWTPFIGFRVSRLGY